MEGWGELEVNEELWDVWKEGSSRKYEITELIDVPHSEKHLLLKRELEEGVGTDKGKTGSVPKQKKHKPLKERWHAKGALPKDASGKTILPALLGNLTVVSLGEVVYDRPKYASARYIYPVGFETTRSYFSPLVIDTKTVYHNKILDGGDAPLFEVSCTEGGQHLVWSAPTPSGAWAQVIKRVNETGTTVRQSQAVSGPVQELPNADKVTGYEFIGDDQ